MTKYSLPRAALRLLGARAALLGRAAQAAPRQAPRGYVTGANATLEKLAQAREKSDYATINQLEKGLAFHISGHILHSLLWRNMSPKGGGEPDGELRRGDQGALRIVRRYEGAAHRGVPERAGLRLGHARLGAARQALVVEQVYDHQGNIGNGNVPCLVIDMWEHAYYAQYRNEKAKWVDAYWKVVNWPDVASASQRCAISTCRWD